MSIFIQIRVFMRLISSAFFIASVFGTAAEIGSLVDKLEDDDPKYKSEKYKAAVVAQANSIETNVVDAGVAAEIAAEPEPSKMTETNRAIVFLSRLPERAETLSPQLYKICEKALVAVSSAKGDFHAKMAEAAEHEANQPNPTPEAKSKIEQILKHMNHDAGLLEQAITALSAKHALTVDALKPAREKILHALTKAEAAFTKVGGYAWWVRERWFVIDEKDGSGYTWWIVGGAVVVLGGAGAFFYFRK